MSRDEVVAILELSGVWNSLSEEHQKEAINYFRNTMEESEQKVKMQSMKKAA